MEKMRFLLENMDNNFETYGIKLFTLNGHSKITEPSNVENNTRHCVGISIVWFCD